MTKHTLLLIDDSPMMLKCLKIILKRMDREIDTVGNFNDAIELIKNKQYSLIISDVNCPMEVDAEPSACGGLDFLKLKNRANTHFQIPEHFYSTPIVMISALPESDIPKIIEQNPTRFLSKSVYLRMDKQKEINAEIDEVLECAQNSGSYASH